MKRFFFFDGMTITPGVYINSNSWFDDDTFLVKTHLIKINLLLKTFLNAIFFTVNFLDIYFIWLKKKSLIN